MVYGPLRDWDLCANEQDAAAEREIQWWARNKDRVFQIAAGMLANPQGYDVTLHGGPKCIVDKAVEVTREITSRYEQE